MNIQQQLYLNEKMCNSLKRLAKKQRVSLSKLAEDFLQEGLDRHKQQKTNEDEQLRLLEDIARKLET